MRRHLLVLFKELFQGIFLRKNIQFGSQFGWLMVMYGFDLVNLSAKMLNEKTRKLEVFFARSGAALPATRPRRPEARPPRSGGLW